MIHKIGPCSVASAGHRSRNRTQQRPDLAHSNVRRSWSSSRACPDNEQVLSSTVRLRRCSLISPLLRVWKLAIVPAALLNCRQFDGFFLRQQADQLVPYLRGNPRLGSNEPGLGAVQSHATDSKSIQTISRWFTEASDPISRCPAANPLADQTVSPWQRAEDNAPEHARGRFCPRSGRVLSAPGTPRHTQPAQPRWCRAQDHSDGLLSRLACGGQMMRTWAGQLPASTSSTRS